ncbi:MAG TPA: isochorismatase family cysteine hydrolase, partial [Acetobacteraceae bacterium]|nr:isochorismatase family cysteine hydrolase [Acetobacteraceae bacterium]
MQEFGPMKGVTMPDWALRRAIGRRGTAHPFADLDPARTALVVIDLQVGFMHERGEYMACAAAREIVPAVNRLAQGLRNAGGLVAWIQNTHDESCLATWTVQQRMNTAAANARRNAAMAPGAPGHALWPELDVRPEDALVLKRRYSAFIPSTCDLAPVLRGRGIDTVLIGGTATNVCCESSARDAMMLNFKVVMVHDVLATYTDEEHNATLRTFYSIF